MTERQRALKRIRRAVTEAIEWHEIAVFAGSGDPDLVGLKERRAKLARATLDRIINEELDRAAGA